jgi:hypothetical protein
MLQIESINRAVRDNNSNFISSIKILNEAEAEALIKWQQRELDLNGLKSLSPTTAIALAKWQGFELNLNGLRSFSPKTASALAEWRGHWLKLMGVKNLSPKTAKALSRWGGTRLQLSGVKTLSYKTATELSTWKGGALFLNGVSSLSPKTAKALLSWKGQNLSLGGVRSLSYKSAIELTRLKDTTLSLKGLQKLPNNVALVIAKLREGHWYFNQNPRLSNDTQHFMQSITDICKKDDHDRLHCDDGPALVIKDLIKVYAIHGVRVLEHVVERPEEITIKEIELEDNVEVRRILIDKYGTERYFLDSDAKLIDIDDFGYLYKKTILNDKPIVMVKVRNSTPEHDGSFKYYYLRVPPWITKSTAAVAWTFGLKTNEYKPALET